jgi:hypothetical protein
MRKIKMRPSGAASTKRIADWIEKFSVGAMLIGVFQYNWFGFTIGTILFVMCIVLSKESQ